MNWVLLPQPMSPGPPCYPRPHYASPPAARCAARPAAVPAVSECGEVTPLREPQLAPLTRPHRSHPQVAASLAAFQKPNVQFRGQAGACHHPTVQACQAASPLLPAPQLHVQASGW